MRGRGPVRRNVAQSVAAAAKAGQVGHFSGQVDAVLATNRVLVQGRTLWADVGTVWAAGDVVTYVWDGRTGSVVARIGSDAI